MQMDAIGEMLTGIFWLASTLLRMTRPLLCVSPSRNLEKILRGKILETGFAEIIWNESFQRLKQVDGSVVYWTKNKLNDHETERTCRYLVGADGGHSAVRKDLDIHLEGYTFESFQFVAVNFQYALRFCRMEGSQFHCRSS